MKIPRRGVSKSIRPSLRLASLFEISWWSIPCSKHRTFWFQPRNSSTASKVRCFVVPKISQNFKIDIDFGHSQIDASKSIETIERLETSISNILRSSMFVSLGFFCFYLFICCGQSLTPINRWLEHGVHVHPFSEHPFLYWNLLSWFNIVSFFDYYWMIEMRWILHLSSFT